MNKTSYNIPNMISLTRLLLVPYIVWVLISDDFILGFFLIVLVSISDAIDGFIARRFNCQTILGQYLDPIADKTLLIALYVTLSYKGFIPVWLAITVVSRDILIVGGTVITNMLDKQIEISPITLSKVNTVVQIFLIIYILTFYLTNIWNNALVQDGAFILYILTFLSTISSGLAYINIWMKKTHKLQ